MPDVIVEVDQAGKHERIADIETRALVKPLGVAGLLLVTATMELLSSMKTRPLKTASGSSRSSATMRPAITSAMGHRMSRMVWKIG